MAELVVPEEILDDILVRLPVKSIIRFESVCKEWHSKSHSTSFTKFYQQQSGKREKKKSESVHTIKLNDIYKMVSPLWLNQTIYNKNFWRRTIGAIGPLSNGIYCLTFVLRSTRGCSDDVSRVRIALYNPSIRHFKFLPPFPREYDAMFKEIASHFAGRVFIGFGLGNNVVAIINYSFKNKNRDQFLVFVYTSKKGWETISCSTTSLALAGKKYIMDLLSPMEMCPRSFLKGCWHWLMLNRGVYRVLSFNFAHQSFDVIALPPILEANERLAISVIVLHDHLALICWRGVYNRYSEFDVWMMMDYGVEESWTRIFNIHPNYKSPFKLFSIYGIDYSVLQEDVGDKSESGGIRIERLFFTGPGNAGKVVSFDRHGLPEVSSTLRHNFEVDVSFSTRGISAYIESLERP